MNNRLIKILFLLLVTTAILNCQETDYGPGYQIIMKDNPSVTGSEGSGMLRLSYLNFYPGNHYDLHSVYLSYDSYFPAIHGGLGFYIADDYLGGIVNEIRGGFSYAYFLKAGKNFFINAGLSASVYHRGYDFGNAILPDQIDPLGAVLAPSGEILANSGRTVFDIGTGFLFISGRLFGGFSVNHLAEPDVSITGSPENKLNRKYLFHLSGDFDLSKSHGLRIRPLAMSGFQKTFFSAGAGVVIESNYLSINTILLTNNNKNTDIQTGFSFKTGRVMIYYNYRFNIVSGNQFLPISLLHQTGISFSLNNVEKRYSVGTINLPEM